LASRSPFTFTLQRAVLRTSDTRLRRLWILLYRLSARLFAVWLLWREWRATAYVVIDEEDFLPGLSDMDLVVVLRDGGRYSADAAARRVRQRATHLRGRRLLKEFPIIDGPRIYAQDELGDLVGSSALTYRLDGRDRGSSRPAAYVGHSSNPDPVSVLTRPGLYATVEGWQRLRGPERRPAETIRGDQQRRLAAWLELSFWWAMLPRACLESIAPRPADLCVKAIAETVRIWAWLARDERIEGRAQALRRGLELLPEEEVGLRHMIELRRSLPRWPDSPLVLDDTLPMLVRLSNRIASLVDDAAAAAGFVDVRLTGDDPFDLVLADGGWKPSAELAGGEAPDILPLADWRGIACPAAPDDTFAVLAADAGNPSAFLTAAAVSRGPAPTMLADRLLLRPGYSFIRTELRAVASRATDPVSFALLDGRRVAAFPDLRGWSIDDIARRAVAEHQTWLHPPARTVGRNAAGRELGMLLSAVRAAALLESVDRGEPELPLTLADGVRSLASSMPAANGTAEEALGHYRAFADKRAKPPPETLTAMRELIRGLPAYASRV